MYTASDMTSPSMAANGAHPAELHAHLREPHHHDQGDRGRPGTPASRSSAPTWPASRGSVGPAIIQSGLPAKAVRSTNIINVTYRSHGPHRRRQRAQRRRSVLRGLPRQDQQGNGRGDRPRADQGEGRSGREADPEGAAICSKPGGSSATWASAPTARPLHPLVQRAISFNESLIQAQKRRIELRCLPGGHPVRRPQRRGLAAARHDAGRRRGQGDSSSAAWAWTPRTPTRPAPSNAACWTTTPPSRPCRSTLGRRTRRSLAQDREDPPDRAVPPGVPTADQPVELAEIQSTQLGPMLCRWSSRS